MIGAAGGLGHRTTRTWTSPWRAVAESRLHAARLLSVAMTAVLIAVAVVASATTPMPAGDSAAGRIEAFTNSSRAQASLPASRLNPELTRAARSYADQMARAEWFDHTGPDGSTLVTRGEAAGYEGWQFLAENLARGNGAVAPREVVDAWMSSPEHRANILSVEAGETGVACVSAGEPARWWCVQLFGRR